MDPVSFSLAWLIPDMVHQDLKVELNHMSVWGHLKIQLDSRTSSDAVLNRQILDSYVCIYISIYIDIDISISCFPCLYAHLWLLRFLLVPPKKSIDRNSTKHCFPCLHGNGGWTENAWPPPPRPSEWKPHFCVNIWHWKPSPGNRARVKVNIVRATKCYLTILFFSSRKEAAQAKLGCCQTGGVWFLLQNTQLCGCQSMNMLFLKPQTTS